MYKGSEVFMSKGILTKREKEGVLDKSFAAQDYEKIKEWLER